MRRPLHITSLVRITRLHSQEGEIPRSEPVPYKGHGPGASADGSWKEALGVRSREEALECAELRISLKSLKKLTDY